jgi:hypothetical protein
VEKTTTTAAAIIAVLALATTPFLVGSSNLVQSAYAKEKVKDEKSYMYCYKFIETLETEDDQLKTHCYPGDNRGTAKQSCENAREQSLADPDRIVISECETTLK